MKAALALLVLAALNDARAFAHGAITVAPGLITTSVIHDVTDYEAVSALNRLDAGGMKRTVRWTREAPGAPGGKRVESTVFSVHAEDLEAAHRVIIVYLSGDPENMPGAVQGMASRAMLREIGTQGSTAVVLGAADLKTFSASWSGALTSGRKYYRGTLTRVERATVPVSMLVDGRRTTLPAWHVKGDVRVGAHDAAAELWILDDREFPMILRWQMLGAEVRMVRIDNPPRLRENGNTGGIELEPGPAGSCHAEVSGIYFASSSAQLLPESRPALERIATLLRQHPDWNVRIEGHTDNLGSADFNLGLSNDRAAHVREALIETFGIPAARLGARGYGFTRPIETNTTLEGRARNRRVELSRKCS